MGLSLVVELELISDPSFDGHIVGPSALSVHAELEDLGAIPTMTQGLLQGTHRELGVQGIGEPPGRAPLSI